MSRLETRPRDNNNTRACRLFEVDPIVWTQNGPSLATLCRASRPPAFRCSCFRSTFFGIVNAPGETEVGSAGEHPTKGYPGRRCTTRYLTPRVQPCLRSLSLRPSAVVTGAMPPKTHGIPCVISISFRTPPPAFDPPTTDATAPRCNTRSRSSSPPPTPAPPPDATGRRTHTSPSATNAPRTRCPGNDLCHPCSPWRPLLPAD